jgi:diguanylate cyclase (GGDEF)-like protein
MLANDAFARLFGRSADSFRGQTLESLPWLTDDEFDGVFGQVEALLSSPSVGGPSNVVRLRIGASIYTFKPNASQICDEQGVARGTLLSLDDITILARRTAELQQLTHELRASRAEIEAQNEQLRFLATRDPLTSCLNRRSFFEQFEACWKTMSRYGHPMGCLMVDIDNFKSINDRFGHSTGDAVLKHVAGVLLRLARETDHVCRYGGEEFCVLLPHVSADGAKQAAERYRQAVAALSFANVSVTVSLGCSSREAGATSIEEFLEQADQALYTAKRLGRNQVIVYTPDVDRLAAGAQIAAPSCDAGGICPAEFSPPVHQP